MADLSSRKPRFKPGDRVSVVVQGSERGRTGIIAEIVSTPVDAVYRYRVSFDDQTSGIFFGFELEPFDSAEAANH
jgi:hypothetical protein